MIMRVYTVFDSKSLIYNMPFYAATNGAAVRMLADLANDLSTSIGRHPSDYVLYCCGHYDDQTAAVTPYSPLEHVVDAVALLRIQSKGDLFSDKRLGEE